MIVWREEEEGGDKYNNAGQGNGNFTFIAIGTIMNIMMIYVSDEEICDLKNLE